MIIIDGLEIQEHFPLSRLTTFRIGGPARYFAEVTTQHELDVVLNFIEEQGVEFMVLGGGSNMLVSDSGFDGLVLLMKMRNFEVVDENKTTKVLRIASGEMWDETVAKIVDMGLWGVENLSLIPGRVGAAAIQNIGAYGQEICTTLDSVEVYDTKLRSMRTLRNEDCGFGYRKSIFNSSERGRFIILNVLLRLEKDGVPKTEYPDVQSYLQDNKIQEPTLTQMREAIVYIRTHKLPDPAKIGNSGSFFRNLYISEKEYDTLKKMFEENIGKEGTAKLEEIKAKFASDLGVKIPAAFLVDVCELRGSRVGGAGLHETQVLVIVNETGEATAEDVLGLVKKVRQTVYKKTGMELVPEPELVGFTPQELEDCFQLE